MTSEFSIRRGGAHTQTLPPRVLGLLAGTQSSTINAKARFLFSMILVWLCFWHLSVVIACLLCSVFYATGLLKFTPSPISPRDAILRRADTLEEPVTDKAFGEETTEKIQAAFMCMQGWRKTMEDSHTMVLDSENGISFFAVFDGHCGSSSALWCAKHLHRFVVDTNQFRAAEYKEALEVGFLSADLALAKAMKLKQVRDDKSGCTACLILVTGKGDIYCANAGDSRAVLCRAGVAVPLSVDHKPHLPAETKRIQDAGGFVWNRRVNGTLALSRALGDFGFKNKKHVPWDRQAVTAFPEVFNLSANDSDEFIVIACDGIWDVLSSERVVAFVRERLQAGMEVRKICFQLLEYCLSPYPIGVGCDNMSVEIIVFRRQHDR